MKDITDEKIIESLRLLGLTRYEALAYYNLNSMVEAKAIEISEKSEIPRTKIYSVLRRLDEKGFIETEKGHPNIYKSIPPSLIFKEEKNKLINQLNATEMELTYNHENQIAKTQAPMWLIRGEEKIINKEIEIIKKAQKTINMRIGFLYKNELEPLKNALNNEVRNNIEVNILVSNDLYENNKKVDIEKILNNEKIRIYKSDIPSVKMMIRDGKEMFHIYSKFKEKYIPVKNTSIGMWNQYEDICENYDKRFYKTIEKSKNRKSKMKT
ncbi:MAG: TrmB family transcriptional regulator [Methanobrevibacter sp.]